MTPRPRTISIDACVGGRDLTEPRLAPDGRSIVVGVSDVDGATLVRVELDRSDVDGTVERASSAPMVVVAQPAPRVGRGLGGGCWCWAADGRAIVYAAVDGNLWWQDLDGGDATNPGAAGRPARRLTDHGPDRVAQAPSAAPDGSSIVYVVDQSEVWCVPTPGATAGDPAGVTSGTAAPIRLDDAGADFCFDPVVTPASDDVVWLAWNVPDMPWDHARVMSAPLMAATVDSAGPADVLLDPLHSVQQPRFSATGDLLCVRDDTGWNNVWLGDRVVVDEPFEHGGPTWGLGQRSFASSPDGGSIAFTRNEAGFGRLCVVEVATGVVRELGRGVHGQVSWAGNRIAALRSGARTPPEVVVYEQPGDERRQVIVGTLHAWGRELLVEPEALEVLAPDGGVIHARLHRADPDPDPDPDTDASDDSLRGGRRLICWLHGGPTDQWQVTFMPRIAYWRSLGWDVLVPDHRGSTGHGRSYQQALRGRWGELDVDDVATVLGHVRDSGIASADRTVLMGGSAGGFTVLGVLRHHPGIVAAAVVAYPVADLADLAERSHRFERHYTRTLVGEPPPPPAVDARTRDRSPTWWADRINTPLLVLHGEDDPVVPVGQSRVLVERMRTAGAQVDFVVYPGEGHGFRRRAHQIDEFERIGAFLARHVAGASPER